MDKIAQVKQKYPIILITIMLCSYPAPLLDNESLEETKIVQETLVAHLVSCISDVRT